MATRPNYHHLYHFWMIAQEGSLAGASRRLGVRHSTLSAQVRTLEKSFGSRLLLRRPRGVRLTPQGEIVRGYCDQIFRLGAELLDATSGQLPGTRLRVGTLPSVPPPWLYEALRPAFERDGVTRAEVISGEIHAVCRELVAGRLHVVVTDRLPLQASASAVHAHLLGETRIGFHGTRRLAERYRGDFPASLNGAPVLLPAAGGVLREGLTAWFAAEGLRPRIVGEFDDVPTMEEFAACGHGLAPVRQCLADEARRRSGLLAVGVVPGLVDRLYALTLGRRSRHPAIQRVIERRRSKMRTG